MDRRVDMRLTVIPLIALIVTVSNPAIAFATERKCSGGGLINGQCKYGGGLSGGGLDLWGEGSGSDSGRVGWDGGGDGGSSDEPWSFLPWRPAGNPCLIIWRYPRCPAKPGDERDTPPRKIVLADLEHFRPVTPSASSQPRGWAVVKLPINFLTNAQTHTQSGAVLGIPVEVRFTPTTSQWDFGDGQSQSSPSQGSRWEEQGLRKFSQTPTSHEYGDLGSRTISPTVSYSAEYRFEGGEWTTVEGTVDVPLNPFTILVAQADTVLVG